MLFSFLKEIAVKPSEYRIDWRRNPVVVFESDDWGATRLFPDIESVEKGATYLPSNWREKYASLVYSTLETASDLQNLFDVLLRHKGGDSLPPVFTANYIVSSPDYTKISENCFKNVFCHRLPDVPKSWNRGDFMEMAKKGIRLGVWCPEYHGLLHMNPNRWIKSLQGLDGRATALFQMNSYAAENGFNSPEYAPDEDIEVQGYIIKEGLAVFRDIFGYIPHSCIAPYGIWQSKTEKVFARQGVRSIQAKNQQSGFEVSMAERIIGKICNLFGLRDANKPWQIKLGDINIHLGIVYLHRNVEFEPQMFEGDGVVEKAVDQIFAAWTLNQPAIISTHRFNFVSLKKADADRCLRLLDELLTMIEQRNPDVMYLTDAELCQHFVDGYSTRTVADKIVIRNFTSENKSVIDLDTPQGQNFQVVTFPNHRSDTKKIFGTRQLIIAPCTTIILSPDHRDSVRTAGNN